MRAQVQHAAHVTAHHLFQAARIPELEARISALQREVPPLTTHRAPVTTRAQVAGMRPVRTLASSVFHKLYKEQSPPQFAHELLGAVHRLANPTAEPVEIIEVQFGSYLGEDDIVRIQDDYGRG